jgi:hypothetical protein
MLNSYRLTIELVPSSCWYSNVRSHVSSATWDKLQERCFSRAKQRCEICQGRGPAHPVELHEIWDYDDRTRVQRLSGLIALCPACHEVKHIGHAIQAGRLPQALSHLIQVNGITSAQSVDYVKNAFDIQERRSQQAWSLDIRLLSTHYGVKLAGDQREDGLGYH